MYSNAVRTDCDVILGLFKAFIAACESDNIFIYFMSRFWELANAYWHAWLRASISAWNTVEVSGMCIDAACILLFLWYITNPAPSLYSVLLPSVYIVVSAFCMCIGLLSKLSVFILVNLS